jgi:hypothetical protein
VFGVAAAEMAVPGVTACGTDAVGADVADISGIVTSDAAAALRSTP